MPPLDGFAYRFTVWLPIQSRGMSVFTKQHVACLVDFLLACCGGCSQSTLEGFPPWSGSWLPEGATKPVVDQHILFVVYTLQDAESVACMRQLKWLLQQDHVAAQQVVLIEQVPAQFVEAVEIGDA